MDLPPADQLLASARKYLMQMNDEENAFLLSMCTASYTETRYTFPMSRDTAPVDVTSIIVNLFGSILAYEVFGLEESGWSDKYGDYTWKPVEFAVTAAFKAVSPPGILLRGVEMKLRQAGEETAHGQDVSNQGVEIEGRQPRVEWKGLFFRSNAEAAVAKALDTVGVLFLPNCRARLNHGEGRVNKEPDFLVCNKGKWGILEVDGPFHQGAATDHRRDRLFKQHGIKVIERFTSDQCYPDALGVVNQFLFLLDRNG